MPSPPVVEKSPASNERIVDEVKDEKPSHSSEPKESDSVKVMPPPPKGGIEVVALRAGYYKCSRKVEGDIFSVPSMNKVGAWMKCVDPKLEQEHQVLLKESKKAGV
jgi:hypothetical protein